MGANRSKICHSGLKFEITQAISIFTFSSIAIALVKFEVLQSNANLFLTEVTQHSIQRLKHSNLIMELALSVER